MLNTEAEETDTTGGEPWTLEELMKRLRELAVGRINVCRQRRNFLNLKQQYRESIEVFMQRLEKTAATCDFNIVVTKDLNLKAGDKISFKDQMVRDMAVMGLQASHIREALIVEWGKDTSKTWMAADVKHFVANMEHSSSDSKGLEGQGDVNSISAYKAGQRRALEKSSDGGGRQDRPPVQMPGQDGRAGPAGIPG